MQQNIKQTFTSTGDPSSNGVAERWIDLVKVKATVLLASRYLPTAFWCYAVPWVAYTYNQKTLGQVPKKSIPEFGQLILIRTKRENKFQERAELGIMMGFYPQIPHGVVAVCYYSAQQDYFRNLYCPCCSGTYGEDRTLVS